MLVHQAPLATGMMPSMMILIAPFEVGFLAFVNVVQRIDAFAALLFYFGLFFFVVLAPPDFPAFDRIYHWMVGHQLPHGCAVERSAEIRRRTTDDRPALSRRRDPAHRDDRHCRAFRAYVAYFDKRKLLGG
jgi:hypothetical protein